MRFPAAIVALPLLAGCAAGAVLVDHAGSEFPLRIASGAFLAFIAAIAFFLDGCGSRSAVAVVGGCVLGGMSLGLTEAGRAYNPDLLSWFKACEAGCRENPAVLEGVLREDAALSAAGVSLVVDVRAIDGLTNRDRRRISGGVRLGIGGVPAAHLLYGWRAGRTIRVPVLLRLPTTYRDPGVPDDARGLARRGVVLLGTVKSGALVEVVAHGGIASEAAAAARAWIRQQLSQCIGTWSRQSAAIAIAILIGDRSGLSDVDERRLQEAGTYHVIAISGGNIAILTAMLLALFRLISVPSSVSAGLTIPALLFYGYLASGGASVARAVTAACVYLGGRILDQRGPPLNALAVTAGIGLAVSPLAALDGGFLLSFGATLGILVGVPRVGRVFAAESAEVGRPRHRHAPPHLRLLRTCITALTSLFLATLCAEVALIPVSALFFSRITVAGLALNFVAIPLMAITQAAALLALVVTPLPSAVGHAVGYVAHLAASGLVRSASLVDFVPWTSQVVVPPPWWLIAIYYASCGLIFQRPWRRVGVAGIGCSVAVMLVPPAVARPVTPPRDGVLRIVFLDVGQGDATLIQLPDRRFVLVDAGGVPGSGFDVGERVVTPALLALGARSIDMLVLTHGDPDHIGGAPAVLRHFSPREIWEGVPVPPHPGMRELAATAVKSRVLWRTVQAADRQLAGGAEIRVLHPPIPDWERQRVRNDDSIVLEIRFGEVSILLPGDIGREAEQRLTPLVATARLTIVKAPHHGSSTSSTQPFIDALHPAAVIFSVGRGNRFGHPAPVVVARYRDSNSMVFRTDEDGAIVLDTDGRSVNMWAWSGRRVNLQ